MNGPEKTRLASADLAPLVAAPTDVARLTHRAPVPAHEQTADQDSDPVDWERAAADGEFKRLVRAKLRFILPATAFFVVYYFALPILVGWAPGWMEIKVFGALNVAYLFALSQFFMAWGIAALYLRAAARFDRLEEEVLARITAPPQPPARDS
ncbi:MAG: DUF485 domain-containing protein [Verrucomicrobiae bacterium]|nr:DUF485 domain-containing protein [Verrucomicrobiae bacterium]